MLLRLVALRRRGSVRVLLRFFDRVLLLLLTCRRVLLLLLSPFYLNRVLLLLVVCCYFSHPPLIASLLFCAFLLALPLTPLTPPPVSLPLPPSLSHPVSHALSTLPPWVVCRYVFSINWTGGQLHLR